MGILAILLISQVCTNRCPAVPNDDSQWKQYLQSADEANEHGSTQLAGTHYAKALAIAEQFGEHDPRFVVTLHKLGNFYLYRAPSSAASYFKRSLTLMETLPRDQVLDLDLALENGLLCEALINQGKFADAEPYAKRKLALQESLLHEDDPALFQSLMRMADCELGQLHYAQAIPFLKRAIEIARARKYATLGNHLLVLARTEVYNLEFSKADDYKQQAIALKNSCVPSAFADDLRTVGVAFMRKERWKEADDCYKETAHILSSAHLEKTIHMAALLADQGRLCYRQGQYTNAEAIHRKALLLIKPLNLPIKDQVVKMIIGFLAQDLEKEGKIEEAAKLQQQLESVRTK